MPLGIGFCGKRVWQVRPWDHIFAYSKVEDLVVFYLVDSWVFFLFWHWSQSQFNQNCLNSIFLGYFVFLIVI
jgi:hypothetical protein